MLTVYLNRSTVCQRIHLFHWAGWRESDRHERKLSRSLNRQSTVAQLHSISNTVGQAEQASRWKRGRNWLILKKTKRVRKWIKPREWCETHIKQHAKRKAAELKGWRRRRLKTSRTTRKLRLPFVHTHYKLLMRALNKWVQCTGRGRWTAQCDSPKITSKNGLVSSGQE